MSYEIAPDPETFKKLLEKHSMKNKFVPDPEFAKSPINIKMMSLISLLISHYSYG